MAPRSIPVVDVSPLAAQGASAPGADSAGAPARERVGAEIAHACREHGFFYVIGHGVPEPLRLALDQSSRRFFAQDPDSKLAIRMELGGTAWRGYFPVGAEKTLGRPDMKEGLYFGAELSDDHPRVTLGVPLHGHNLFPEVPDMRATVLEYIDEMTRLGHVLMEGIALGLGLEAAHFAERYTRDPLVLFRVFHYPPLEPLPADGARESWSVAEHTDYGLLTILGQDDAGGLQVRSRGRWIDAPPIPGAFLCNIGDMLERMTGGLFRSTPHRVRNTSGRGRLSFPFFFDPDFEAEVRPLLSRLAPTGDASERWDGQSVHAFEGTYGEYVVAKVSRVFPELARAVLGASGEDHGESGTPP